MSKSIGHLSVFVWNGTALAGLKKTGNIDMTRDSVDATDMQSLFDEILAGGYIKTNGIPIEGYFDAADAGQQGLESDFLSGTLRAFSIIMPNAASISGSSAMIMGYKIGDVEDGIIPFSATVKPNGAVAINRTLSAGLTTPFLAVSGAGTLIVPAPAGSTYEYTVNIATGVSSVTITPTASTGVITITDSSGNSQTVTSGAASTAIALGAAGSRTTVLVTVQESGKVPKVYTVDLVRAAA